MTIDFVKYIISHILFPNIPIKEFSYEIKKGNIIISYEDKKHSEKIFSDNNLFLSNQDYKLLDEIYNDILKENKSNYNKLNILKLVYYFSNEFYLSTIKPKDKHDRYFTGSIKENDIKYLEIPIVNILSNIFEENLQIKQDKKIKLNFTCDYDILNIWSTSSYKWILKRHLKNLLKHPLLLTFKEIKSFFLAKYSVENNPYLNAEMFLFDNQYSNIKISNYAFFLVDQGHKYFDPKNNFEEKSTILFLKKLLAMDVEIGLHPNYNSQYDGTLKNQLIKFKSIFKKQASSSRNHYLRGNWPSFLLNLETNGVEKDFSFGFADSLLFRGGISSRFKMWNIEQKRAYNTWLSPLTIMDGTLQDYYSESLEKSFNMCLKKLELCYKFGDEITLLWHNRSMYKYGFEENILPDLFTMLVVEIKRLNNKYAI